MRKRPTRSRRRAASIASIAMSLLGTMTLAHAGATPRAVNGTVLEDAVDLLLGDTIYGERTITGRTIPVEAARPDACKGLASPSAAVYAFDARPRARLRFTYARTAGEQICRVQVYKSKAFDNTLTDLYSDQAADHHVLGCRCFEKMPDFRECTFGVMLASSDAYADRYYVVLWPDANPAVESTTSTFRLRVQVRRESRVHLGLGSASEPSPGAPRQLRNLHMDAQVIPRTATGAVRFTIHQRRDGRWAVVDQIARKVSSGLATATKPLRGGQYRVDAVYLGDATTAPSRSRGTRTVRP